MFPADALPAIYIEEREMEIRAARKAEMERAARCIGQPTSACSTPMASPSAGFGFFAGFFSAIRGTPAGTTPVMSRSTSSSGPATCSSASTSEKTQ